MERVLKTLQAQSIAWTKTKGSDEIVIRWKNGEIHIIDGQIAMINMYSFSYLPSDGSTQHILITASIPKIIEAISTDGEKYLGGLIDLSK